MDTLTAKGVTVRFNPEGGCIDELALEFEHGALIRPLHRAPWVDSGEALPENLAPVERNLAGDFFCAPFSNRGPETPIHGWAANGRWERLSQKRGDDGSLATSYQLTRSIHGAALTKKITLRPDHPVIYQRHQFTGGEGHIPIAHHAMVHVPGGAALSFSPKAHGVTPNAALEADPARGRSLLLYPQHFESLSEIRLADGGVADASSYPFAGGHEDFLAMVESGDRTIAWSAALAAKDGFLFFAVKDARALPETLLWMSNGGRSYAPWLGRHTCVLGIEEAATHLHVNGEINGPPGKDQATGTLLWPAKVQGVRYALGAIPAPEGWTRIADITVSDHSLTLTDASGGLREVPFDGAFLSGPAA